MCPHTAAQAAAPPDGFVRIHYFRQDWDSTQWTVYSFGDTAEPTDNYYAGPSLPAGSDGYGAYFDIRLAAGARTLGFIVHNLQNGAKDPGPDMHLDVTRFRQVWIVSGDATVYTAPPPAEKLLKVDFGRLQAFWIDRSTVALPPHFFRAEWSYALIASPHAQLRVSEEWKLQGAADRIDLRADGQGLDQLQRTRFPQLDGYAVFRLQAEDAVLKQLLRGQIAIAAFDGGGAVRYLTGIQHAGVLDDLFPDPGLLGLTFGDRIQCRVWAPTAQSIDLLLFKTATQAQPDSVLPMHEANGTWSTSFEPAWRGRFYLFRVTVYVPEERQIVKNEISDPYSVDLALNGMRSRITDLGAPENKPAGWDTHQSPALPSKNDVSIYELHVRDFSANDPSVAPENRGTYLAFGDPETHGMRHLRALAQAGLRAVHLLPTFHFSTVNEDKSAWKSPGDLSTFTPESEEQQARIVAVQNEDAYNWGYDPVHYLAPAGAYARDPSERVKEYRAMIMALHQAGLRVVQDLVFNHTVAAGQARFSVFDKIVPGYYHRLDADGKVLSTSCCPDTASEHRMMEKLMIDAIVQSAREYKIDAFRFDLMGYHFVSNLERIATAVAGLTVAHDGVDGSKIYLYGEGWEMGTTAWNALGRNASQRNLFGMGIGTFNDRARDAVRGGNPFSEKRLQGFATGLFTHSSEFTNATQSANDQHALVLLQSDWTKATLAGNLRDFTFVDRNGSTVKASDVIYNGQPAAYAASPLETVNYCSVHDNQTLFDAIQMKVSGDESTAQRARRQIVALSLISLAQGIPFFQAADDLLRSKDMDQDSFNSGDWFNRIDFTYQTNNWGIGLPPAKHNAEQWPIMRPLLASTHLKPGPADIAFARDRFRELLAIRRSSPLFRMATLDEVQSNLRFLNNGPAQIPGLIVMRLDADRGAYGEPYRRVLVLFNARAEAVAFRNEALQNLGLSLHPIERQSSDAVVRASEYRPDSGEFMIPALTTTVFVE